MASEAADILDPTLARADHRGERNKVVLHHDVDPGGAPGPDQLHLGPVVGDTVARDLGCDAEVIVAAYRAGPLIGITPTTRTAPRHLRRVIERRDQGCTHPLCPQTRRLHIHHIVHGHHRGLTIPSNRLCVAPPTTVSSTRSSSPSTATRGPHAAVPRSLRETLRLDEPSANTPPHGERLDRRWFTGNQPRGRDPTRTVRLGGCCASERS